MSFADTIREVREVREAGERARLLAAAQREAMGKALFNNRFPSLGDMLDTAWERVGDTLRAKYCDQAEALHTLLSAAREGVKVEEL